MRAPTAVDITGIKVRPVPKELFETVLCTNCRQSAARWELAEGAERSWLFACSCCLLYELPKLKGQRLSVDRLIEAVEGQLSQTFTKDSEGRLLKADDSDRIAFGVVMAGRVMKSRSRGDRP